MMAGQGTVKVWVCEQCEAKTVTRVTFCQECGSPDIRMEEADASGDIVSWTLVTVPEERFASRVPYAYCVVQGEGFMFPGWCLKEDAGPLKKGVRVRAAGEQKGPGLRLLPE